MRILAGVFIFLVSVTASIRLLPTHRPDQRVQLFQQLCELVQDKIFLSKQVVGPWEANCRSQVTKFNPKKSLQQWVSQFNGILDALPTSHLQLVAPAQTERMWQDQGLDTGIRARRIEGEWVIYRVISNSVAALLHLRAGDVILGLDGHPINSEDDAVSARGSLRLKRGNQQFTVAIAPELLNIDNRPRLGTLSDRVGLLTLPDFLPTHYTAPTWTHVAMQLPGYSRLIVDLRDNDGGSFVAMLRVLSTFMCRPQRVGILERPKFPKEPIGVFADDLNDDVQSQVVNSSSEIELNTFGKYGCYHGPVQVLINENTASVAEIFADAMARRARTHILGTPSSGEVVLAEWYPIAELGRDFALSIPEAVYVNPAGEILEGRGVRPNRILGYRLDEAKRGLDSWLKQAGSYDTK